MCGRYTLYTHEDDLASLFEVITYPLTERYNVAPTQTVPIIVQQASGERVMTPARWGLIPHWVADPKAFKANLFNARAESAAERPSFRDAMRSRRCIVPATGFYEWRKLDDSKQPYHIQRADGDPFVSFSLDHAIWFHRPLRADQWHLTALVCQGIISSRGLAVGHVFTEAGVHVATISQEVLLRKRRT